jgi:hypothetical protein
MNLQKSNFALLFVMVFVFLSCQPSTESNKLSSPKKEDDHHRIDFIKKLSVFFEIEPNSKVLIIPVDVSCPACRDKSLDFVAQNDASNLYTIITSNDAIIAKKLIKDKNLSNKKRLYLDVKNYCFLQDLAFMKPVIYEFEGKKMVRKTELTPLNIDKELSKLIRK